MAKTDAADTTTATTGRAPRQQRRSKTAPAATFTAPDGYATARRRFEADAQRWLLDQPERTMMLPDDLVPVAALGVPCQRCGSAYRDGDAKHTVSWRKPEDKGSHWAAGITATCASAA